MYRSHYYKLKNNYKKNQTVLNISVSFDKKLIEILRIAFSRGIVNET